MHPRGGPMREDVEAPLTRVKTGPNTQALILIHISRKSGLKHHLSGPMFLGETLGTPFHD